MILSELGQAAQSCWLEIPDHHEGVGLDAFVVMPDHVHGIVIIGAGAGGDIDGRTVLQGRSVQLNGPASTQLNGPPLPSIITGPPSPSKTTGPTSAQLNRSVQLNGPASTQLNGPAFSKTTGPSPHPTQPPNSKSENMSAISPAKGSLSVIIRTYKAAVSTWARRNGRPEFAWQSLFYDHIIRSKWDLERIRKYIRQNPAMWTLKRGRGRSKHP